MARGGINEMAVRQPWAWLGVHLVLLFLGHDLLMAAEASAAPVHGGEAGQHAMADHGTLDALSPGEGGHREPVHPDGCGVVQTVAPRIADESDWSADVPSVVLWSVESLGLLALNEPSAVWQEPKWPADIQRALFQVFRI